jgi:hypothetical protein
MGDQMGRPSASGVIARARTGYCSFSTRGLEASPNINQHIGLLLSFIGDRTEAIKNVIREDNLECKIVCFFGSQAQRQNWTINAENELVAQSFGIAVVRETITTNIEIDIDRTSPG